MDLRVVESAGEPRRPARVDRVFTAIDGLTLGSAGRRWRIEVLGIHTDGTTLWVQCVAANARKERRQMTVAIEALTIEEAVARFKAAIHPAVD